MEATRDKQLSNIDPVAVKKMAAEGGALTLKELAVVLNYSYEATRNLAKQPGFPMLANKVALEDYKEWKRARFTQRTGARRQG